MTTHGIHHVTMICHDIQQNVDFFVGRLGLRRVKTTVNFDDPGAYHLYYGDPQGRPGTLITYFAYPDGRKAQPGAGTATAVALAIPAGTYEFWSSRFPEAEAFERFGERNLRLADPDGLEVVLTETTFGPAEAIDAWRHPEIPAEFAILGIHRVDLQEGLIYHTEPMLTEGMGYERLAEEGGWIRYRIHEEIGGFLDVMYGVKERAHGGAGSIHHVAFRVNDDEEQLQWLLYLRERGMRVSPQMERNYFRSIYFREMGGVLFELATDGPGMLIDEPIETLGQSLRLPENVEPHRAEIEAVLPPIQEPVTV